MKIILGICVCSASTRTTRTPDWIVLEIRGIIYLMRNAYPLTWESRKNYIDITLYNLPFEIKPDSVVCPSTLSPSTSVFGLFDDKRPSKGGKPVADPKSSSVLSGRTLEGLGRLLTKPHTAHEKCSSTYLGE
jgi:hypothetical protein